MVCWGGIAENFCVDFRGQGDAAAFQQFLYPPVFILFSFLYQLRFFRFPDGFSTLKHFLPARIAA